MNVGRKIAVSLKFLSKFGELEALHPAGPVRRPTPPKIPRFIWIPPQVSSSYSKKYVNTAIFFVQVSLNIVKKKKYDGVSTETLI